MNFIKYSIVSLCITANSYIYAMDENKEEINIRKEAVIYRTYTSDDNKKDRITKLSYSLSHGVVLVDRKSIAVQEEIKKGRLREIIIRDGKSYMILFKNKYGDYLDNFKNVSRCYVPDNVSLVTIILPDKNKKIHRCVIPEGWKGPDDYVFVIEEGKKGAVISVNDFKKREEKR